MHFIDLAKRAYDHSFKIDPVIRSLLDTDFYKFLMLLLIWQKHRDVPVTLSVHNRTKIVRLAELIPESELRAQLDHVRELSFRKSELIWLAGNTFYGRKGIFPGDFIDWLGQLRLPDYRLAAENGQYRLDFTGSWAEVTLWEIYALAIINELKARAVLRNLGRLELDILYARAKAKAWSKIARLAKLEDLNITEFGTRRRHSFLWQHWIDLAMIEGLGERFTGTSNAYLAMQLDLEAKGTNAHELPMVYAAMAGGDDEAVKRAPYRVLEDWQQLYPDALRVMLPDTYGTTQFLEAAPDWVAGWTGVRIDSKDPATGSEEMIAWWRSRGEDPRDKLMLFSDGIDIDEIEMLHARFHKRVRLAFGWGTKLTNDFAGCLAHDSPLLDAISLVCKVSHAAGRSAVKLSDNFDKASGSPEEVARYRRLFGERGIERRVIEV
ncbi:MAG TPA: nicotinate phosphoribosyltransferase [Dongiaceae bacterium]|nr:nicotinate phosphoribosyltransferase [Dongiaceae bacterium]